MALITLLSDFGETDHYVSAVKARILSVNPNLAIIDIAHQIECCDLSHAAFIANSVFENFPAGSVHLIGVCSSQEDPEAYIAMKIRDHFFVGADNGIFGLIEDQPNQSAVMINPKKEQSTFPARDILAPAAAKLASGTNISDLGTPQPEYRRMMGRTLKATRARITGHVIRVDHFGNLITNISREVFEELSFERKYRISFGRESAFQIHKNYQSVEHGDCFVLFNSLGLMEIGIHQGNAKELLGLDHDSTVIIDFET
jgi:hypothetical protein